eukprot:6486190-Amphidinium_carterae.1
MSHDHTGRWHHLPSLQHCCNSIADTAALDKLRSIRARSTMRALLLLRQPWLHCYQQPELATAGGIKVGCAKQAA